MLLQLATYGINKIAQSLVQSPCSVRVLERWVSLSQDPSIWQSTPILKPRTAGSTPATYRLRSSVDSLSIFKTNNQERRSQFDWTCRQVTWSYISPRGGSDFPWPVAKQACILTSTGIKHAVLSSFINFQARQTFLLRLNLSFLHRSSSYGRQALHGGSIRLITPLPGRQDDVSDQTMYGFRIIDWVITKECNYRGAMWNEVFMESTLSRIRWDPFHPTRWNSL